MTKNLVYTIWEEIRIDPNFTDKQINTLTQFKKYKDRLTALQKEYAEKYCNAEYKIIYTNCKDMNTMKAPCYIQSDYDTINFEKVFLLEDFAKSGKYENILYMDLDMIPSTTKSFFEKFDMSKIVIRHEPSHRYDKLGLQALLDTLIRENEEHKKYFESLKKSGKWIEYAREFIDKNFDEAFQKLDKYHWLVKSECVDRMLDQFEVIPRYNTLNTGTIGGSSKAISLLKISERFPQYVKEFEQLKKKEPKFQMNNEIFLCWLINKYNCRYQQMPEHWHSLCLNTEDVRHACMWQVIDKNFDRALTLQNFS